MAKSLRSKHKRKMRAIKREKNEPRVLKQLKNTLQNSKLIITEGMVKLKELEELKKQRREQKEKELAEAKAKEGGTRMEVERCEKKKNKKSAYPSWATGRTLRKMQQRRRYLTKKKKRKMKRN